MPSRSFTEEARCLEQPSNPPAMGNGIEAVKEAFSSGLPVLIFDSEMREGETDLLFPALDVQPAQIRQLRQVCGGLLFLAIGDEVAERFGMPFLQDVHTTPSALKAWPVLGHLITHDLRYDQRSAFTVSLNHRDTFTGITDHDRALTVRRFAELSVVVSSSSTDEAIEALGREFRTPGHIPVCREAKGGLSVRQGHTELAVAVSRLAGCPPVVVGAEMLEPDGDLALSRTSAEAWGRDHGVPFITGGELLAAVESEVSRS